MKTVHRFLKKYVQFIDTIPQERLLQALPYPQVYWGCIFPVISKQLQL